MFPTMALTEHMHRHLRNLHCALPISTAAMAVKAIPKYCSKGSECDLHPQVQFIF